MDELNVTTKTKNNRQQRSVDEKYDIIKYYESIESKGRAVKEETRRKFNIVTISSLNAILNQKDEVVRIYESNKSSSKRVRLTGSRLPLLDQKLYESFAFLRDNQVEVSDEDISTKAAFNTTREF